MTINNLHSIQNISIQYGTGDLPVLVLCSDKQKYICKYARSSSAIAYKLACEYIGASMAELWKIETPPMAFVNIKSEHWATIIVPHSSSVPAIGFRKIENVLDITPTTFSQVNVNTNTLYQLLKISLFDFWVANEDRTSNNSNLLYDIEHHKLISIDYGGVLNNVSFDYACTQLTETDSILCSDLSEHILSAFSHSQLTDEIEILYNDYKRCIEDSKYQYEAVLALMPKEWSVPVDKVENKLIELFSEKWCNNTWDNFIETLKTNSNYGKDD